LLKKKSDVLSIFQMFHRMIQTQFNTSITIERSDNKGEYMSSDLCTYFCEHCNIYQNTCVDTPQQNNVAELKNQHLLKVTQPIMLDIYMFPNLIGVMHYLLEHISSIECPLMS
jgi:hypothetical protein